MLVQSIVLAALASFAAAAPTVKARTYYGVGLEINTAPDGQPKVLSPAAVEINKLTSLGGISASSISLGIATGVDLGDIECRTYKDAAGVEPGSAPFTYKDPAELSTNLVEVGSVLCYIIETS